METIERQKHTIDASGQSLGRLAVSISLLLRGKQKREFAPHKDVGDFVAVTNIDKVKVTGKKPEQKMYYRHSGYLGGLKQESLKTLAERRPGEVLRRAVSGMLPKNKLRAVQINRLTIE